VKNLLGGLVILFTLVCGFAAAQAPQSQLSQAQVQEPAQNWGPIVKGVRAGLSIDKTTYRVGEDVPLHIVFENVSAADPIYGEPYRARPAFDVYFSSSGKVTVQDEDGPLIPTRPVTVADLPTGGGPLRCPEPYSQGTPVRFEKSLNRVRLLPREPGTYKITVTWSPYTEDISTCQDYLTAAAGPAPKLPSPFVFATSNPVFIRIEGDPFSANELDYTGWKGDFSLTDTSFGEKTALLDKATSLEWLRLNFTVALSYDRIVKELQPGGALEGWRMATLGEVRTFFAHFTGTTDNHPKDPTIERKLQRLLGGPLDEVSNPSTGWHRSDTRGYVFDPNGPVNKTIHMHEIYIGEDSGPFVTVDPDTGGSEMPANNFGNYGTFLVRDFNTARSGSPSAR